MHASSAKEARLAALREEIARSSARALPALRALPCRSGSRRWTAGSPAAGWRRRLHEAAAASPAPGDDAAATLFLAAAAARFSRAVGLGQVLWAVTRRDLFAPGLAQAGLGPDRLLYAECRNDEEVLAVMEEGVRHGSLAAVVGEVGRAEMAATRRLQLAAEEGGTAALLLRRWRKAGADPLMPPSAAATRWRLGCAPATPLPHEGIGRARWHVVPGPPARRPALSIGSWRPPMPRLASLFLPDLAIDRIRRTSPAAA